MKRNFGKGYRYEPYRGHYWLKGGLDRCILFVVRRASASTFSLITSAVGTALLCNEGKARNETLGKHGHKK